MQPEHAAKNLNCVLVYGSDKLLLDTRTMVLVRAGFRVLAVLQPSEPEPVIEEHPVGLVVLCHSLSAARCESLLEFTKSRRPAIRTLVLTAGASVCADQHPTDVLSTFDGPERLTEAVRRLLADSVSPS